MGTKLHRPIVKPWLSLNDLQRGDQAVWVGQGNADGSFEITGVPDGNYFLAYWDEKLHYILDFVQVTVSNGQTTDVGIRMLTGWFTEVSGTVFHDVNENGRRDPGEPGIPHYVVVLKDRDNTEIDRMSIASTDGWRRILRAREGLPDGFLDGAGSLQRPAPHHRRHLPDPEHEGRKNPARADRRHRLAARPGTAGAPGLGCEALQHQPSNGASGKRRHRRHRVLRYRTGGRRSQLLA
jgi:hypothetical protein